MNKLLVTAIALTLCGSTCAAGKRDVTPKETLVYGKRVVMNGLKDPESARFRSLRVGGEGAVLCGEVNAKNGYGGYVGFKRFYVIHGDEKPSLEGTDEFLEITYRTFCEKG